MTSSLLQYPMRDWLAPLARLAYAPKRLASIMTPLALYGARLPTEECPILGPAFPADFDPAGTRAMRDAIAGFPSQVQQLFDLGAVDRENTSFIIDVFSTATQESLYTYSHEAPALNGTLTRGTLNDQTIFRVGSVSKLITVYAILAKAGLGIFDHPVTDYVPELRSAGGIRWEDVTVGALASQQAGTGGVPLDNLSCFIEPDTDGCGVEDFLRHMREEKRPVTAPFQTPLYSDAGFVILGRVVERITGMSYNEAVQSLLGTPLGLKSTTSKKPTGDFDGLVIPGPPEKSSWGLDSVVYEASGGVYTSCADLRAIGSSILNADILSPAASRRWMKPLASTSSLTVNVGAPWEIHRLRVPVTPGSSRVRVSDLYTKLGGNAGYAAVVALSPDHAVGFSILLAGRGAVHDRIALRNLVGETFVTAAEHAAAENAATNFAGTFGTGDNNITLSVDSGRPGLGIQSWFEGGVDYRAKAAFPIPARPNDQILVRLYPTGLVRPDTDGRTRVSLRVVPEVKPLGQRSEVEGGSGMFDGCQTWMSVGFFGDIDEFVVEVVEGRAVSVTSMATGTTHQREHVP